MKQQCPKCGNWVEGKKVVTFARKMTRGAVKNAGTIAKVAIDSLVPKTGTIIDGALDLATDALMDDDIVNEVANFVEDIVFDEFEYEFTCPKCGKIWTNYLEQQNHVNYDTTLEIIQTSSLQNIDIPNPRRLAILKDISSCSNQKNLHEGSSMAFANINSSKLKQVLKEKYGVTASNSDITSCKNVKDLINKLLMKIPASVNFQEQNNANSSDSQKKITQRNKKNNDISINRTKTTDVRRLGILREISSCSKNENLDEECTMRFANINPSKLSKLLKDKYGVSVREVDITICGTVKELVGKLLVKIPKDVTFSDLRNEKTEYRKNTVTKIINQYSEEELEYLDEIKACLEEDNEISPKERRLLDRLRIKLNISEGRAKELEGSLKVLQLTEEEREYLEEYKACLDEDGEISPKERRLLDRFRDKLGISEERVLELENSIR